MRRASRFQVSGSWQVLIKDMKLDVRDILSLAGLPADLFVREGMSLTANEYFSLWAAIDKAAQPRDVALLLAEYLSVEAFDAPIFACVCSPNLRVALTRLQQYKPLIAPQSMSLTIDATRVDMTLRCYGATTAMPEALAMIEVVFFVQLARLATRERISPVCAEVPALPGKRAEIETYLGCKLTKGRDIRLVFRRTDAERPFLTANAAIWSYFEGNLNRRLHDLDADAGFEERVRAALLELLPSGETTIDAVASKLLVSRRTLQRKLAEEAETFQSVLQSVRRDLADHYLNNSSLSLSEISFMLGFQESNSFIRAYQGWTGKTPGTTRANGVEFRH